MDFNCIRKPSVYATITVLLFFKQQSPFKVNFNVGVSHSTHIIMPKNTNVNSKYEYKNIGLTKSKPDLSRRGHSAGAGDRT